MILSLVLQAALLGQFTRGGGDIAESYQTEINREWRATHPPGSDQDFVGPPFIPQPAKRLSRAQRVAKLQRYRAAGKRQKEPRR
jgi:hypothetical protein